MNKKMLCAALLALVVTGGLAFGQEKKEVSLTLEDSIIKALKNNLNLAVEVISPELYRASITRANEMYIPKLDLDVNDYRQESPATWSIVNTGNTVTRTLDSGAQVTQQIPFGGSLVASLGYYRNKTNQLFQNYNPYYQSTLNFTLTQPLLRNFGWAISRKEIIVAQSNFEISRSQFKTILATTIFSVETAYWNLVYAIQDLEVRQQSLKLGQDLLAKTKKEVEVGQKAPIEVLNAEATVATREAEILQAEAQVKSNREHLKALLNLDAESQGQIIIPADKPAFKPVQITFEEALLRAMARRPDLEVTKFTIETKRFNFSYAKNQLLPRLDLKLIKMSPGISGDRLLYLNNDPFTGVVVGTIPGSMGQSLRDAFKFLYNNWTVGITLSIPIGDIVSRAAYAQARLDLEQEQARLKLQEQQISLEVSDAVLDLETAAKSVDAYRVARELAEKQLEAEMKKLTVGMSTNYFVLDYQDRLATAKSNEIKSLVSYSIAVAKMANVTGTSLDARNITIDSYINK